MPRSILPSLLASLGYILIVWALTMPLFEWDISSVRADYPPDYEVHLAPTPWKTKLGESLDDRSYTLFKIFISADKKTCMNEEGLHILAERSLHDKKLESLSIQINEIVSWLPFGLLFLVLFSGIYTVWAVIWREHRPLSHAIASILIVLVLFCFLVGLLRLLGPKMSWDFFVVSYDCLGSLTFRAELSKIHYEMPVTFCLGVFAQLGALGMILREVVTEMKGKP